MAPRSRGESRRGSACGHEDGMKRVWLVLPDQLSIRIFFDAGIVDGLRDRLGSKLVALFLVSREEAEEEPANGRCAGALRR